jgi:adenylosuccinate lyase
MLAVMTTNPLKFRQTAVLHINQAISMAYPLARSARPAHMPAKRKAKLERSGGDMSKARTALRDELTLQNAVFISVEKWAEKLEAQWQKVLSEMQNAPVAERAQYRGEFMDYLKRQRELGERLIEGSAICAAKAARQEADELALNSRRVTK